MISYWAPIWAWKLKKKIKPKAFLFSLITIDVAAVRFLVALICDQTQ